jgi:hypothetical protein
MLLTLVLKISTSYVHVSLLFLIKCRLAYLLIIRRCSTDPSAAMNPV